MKKSIAFGVLLVLSACAQGASGPRGISIVDGVSPLSASFKSQVNDLVAKAGRSYVTLSVKDPAIAQSQEVDVPRETVTAASGFAIDNEGLVLTAAHVAISNGWLVTARGPGGRSYQGRVIAILPKMDSALVQLDSSTGLRPVTPVADPCLKPGEPVFSLGKPRKLGDTARLGSLVSMSFGRPVTYQGYGYSDAMVLRLQTRRGESGGPVFNARGKLVGMLVSTLSDRAGRPLDLAHAVTLPKLAEFVCSKTRCSPEWRALAGKSIQSCPKPKTARARS